jgi:hypothetical protein
MGQKYLFLLNCKQIKFKNKKKKKKKKKKKICEILQKFGRLKENSSIAVVGKSELWKSRKVMRMVTLSKFNRQFSFYSF